MATASRKIEEWRKDALLLSTDPALVPLAQLIAAFHSPEFYWAKPMPEPAMKQMLDNSMLFAVYDESLAEPEAASSRQLIGFARCVTDFCTFAYVTDVWVKPDYQGKGIGAWIVRCIDETLERMPHLRRALLFTADWQRSVPFYKRLMGMEVLDSRPGKGLAIMEKKGKGHPSYGKIGSSYD